MHLRFCSANCNSCVRALQVADSRKQMHVPTPNSERLGSEAKQAFQRPILEVILPIQKRFKMLLQLNPIRIAIGCTMNQGRKVFNAEFPGQPILGAESRGNMAARSCALTVYSMGCYYRCLS